MSDNYDDTYVETGDDTETAGYGDAGNTDAGYGESGYSESGYSDGGVTIPEVTVEGSPDADGAITIPEVTVEGVPMTEHEAEEYIKHVLEGTHILGGVAEAMEFFELGHMFPRLAPAIEVAGPVGWIATLIVMAWETYEAFNTRNNIDRNMGKCYGVLCEAEGSGDPSPPPQDEGGLPLDEGRSYWYEGLAEGRGKVADQATKNKVLLACAKHGETAVLNALWQEVCQGRHPESFFVLSWPTAGISGTNMG